MKLFHFICQRCLRRKRRTLESKMKPGWCSNCYNRRLTFTEKEELRDRQQEVESKESTRRR